MTNTALTSRRQATPARSSRWAIFAGAVLVVSLIAGQVLALDHVHAPGDHASQCSLCVHADNPPLADVFDPPPIWQSDVGSLVILPVRGSAAAPNHQPYDTRAPPRH